MMNRCNMMQFASHSECPGTLFAVASFVSQAVWLSVASAISLKLFNKFIITFSYRAVWLYKEL